MITETLIPLPDNDSLKTLFANVANFKTDVRFVLRGVLLDPAGVLIATDGHAMAEVDLPLPLQQDKENLVHMLDKWCAAVSTKETPIYNLILQPWKVPARSGPWALKIEGPHVFAIDNSGRNHAVLLSTENSCGRYPEWRRVSAWGDHWKPAGIGGAEKFTLGVNPSLLSRFQPDKDRPVRVVFSGNRAAMRVQAFASDIRGTVMPALV